MNKIKIAQIGTSGNSHGKNIFETLKKLPDIFEVVGYALPENEREKFPEKMNVFEGYNELTVYEILSNPDIDAVAIETEEIFLTKYAILAAEKGKHIHMEKPGGTELVSFEKLIEKVKSKNLVFHTGYMYRYNPYIIQLKKDIADGKLGDIISIEAQMNCYHPLKVRQWFENFPGGMMFFLGCHLVDLIFSLQGMPQNVIPLNRSTGVEGALAKDFAMSVFEYEKGVSFAKVNSVEVGGFARRQLVISGTKATVELNPLERVNEEGLGSEFLYTGRNTYTETAWSSKPAYERSEVYDRYAPMLEAFSKMVKGEMKNPYTYDYELELYKLLLKACGE